MITIKRVGIILRKFTENNKEFIGSRFDLFKTLKKYDVSVLAIPQTNSFSKIKELIDLCDGIILPGGDSPLSQDFYLIKYLYEKDIPTLGICLGMQSMAKYFGKHKELSIEGHYSFQDYVHEVNIKKDSLLYKIIQKETILVNSRHHSYIPKTNLKVNATYNNIIEGVEDPTKKFFLGLEWHPESLNDINSKKIFAYFLNIL